MSFIFLFRCLFQVHCWRRSVKCYTSKLTLPLIHWTYIELNWTSYVRSVYQGVKHNDKTLFPNHSCLREITPKSVFSLVFFRRHWRFRAQKGDRKGTPSLSFTTTSTRSQAFRYLFATLHLRWLQRIFNQNTCNYQTNTWFNGRLYYSNFLWTFVILCKQICSLLRIFLYLLNISSKAHSQVWENIWQLQAF